MIAKSHHEFMHHTVDTSFRVRRAPERASCPTRILVPGHLERTLAHCMATQGSTKEPDQVRKRDISILTSSILSATSTQLAPGVSRAPRDVFQVTELWPVP